MKLNSTDINKINYKSLNFGSKQDKPLDEEPKEKKETNVSAATKTFVTSAIAIAALTGGYILSKGKLSKLLSKNVAKTKIPNSAKNLSKNTASVGHSTANVGNHSASVNSTATNVANQSNPVKHSAPQKTVNNPNTATQTVAPNTTSTVKKTVSSAISTVKNTISKNRSALLNKILVHSDKNTEAVLSKFDFAQFSQNGIPLKYSRNDFVNDLNNAISKLDSSKQEALLKKFGLEKGLYGGINGVPVFNAKPDGTKEFDDVLAILKKFTIENESTIQNPQAKQVVDSLIKGLPEFAMMIGKRQHGTHQYSVDIHSLLVLQKAMNNGSYAKLSDESKLVLKMTAFLHDFGKMEKLVTKGHAAQSKVLAQELLKDINLPQDVKNRILNHVDNHHWFEYFNKGQYSTDDVVKIFGNGEDLDIAKILAKADFESVNPSFHLERMNPFKFLTQSQFDDEFAMKISQIGKKKINIGRTLTEQITHLENNNKKEILYKVPNGPKSLNTVCEQVEKYSKQGDKGYWLKIKDELYYVPQQKESPLMKISDDLYALVTGANREFVDLGKFSKNSKGISFADDTIKGFRFVQTNGKISDNPEALYKGFGLDCLLETSLDSKNLLVTNTGVIRKTHGLTPYEWQFNKINPQKQLKETVNVSSYFKDGESAALLKNITKDDLIKSFDELEKIKPENLKIGTYDVNGDNYNFISETLQLRKDYLKSFKEKIISEPQKLGESLYDYLVRIENSMPKPKTYECPMNDHLMMTLTRSQKDVLEKNYQIYKSMLSQKVMHNADSIMHKNSYIHNTPYQNFDEIIEHGLFSGQINIGKKVNGSSVGGNYTSTPAELDLFKVDNEQKIADYFKLSNRSVYEKGWLPQKGKEETITFVLDTNNITDDLAKSMVFHGNQIQNPTHWAIPMGVAPQTIEKIIVHPDLSSDKIQHMKALINQRGLDVKIFDTNGNLL